MCANLDVSPVLVSVSAGCESMKAWRTRSTHVRCRLHLDCSYISQLGLWNTDAEAAASSCHTPPLVIPLLYHTPPLPYPSSCHTPPLPYPSSVIPFLCHTPPLVIPLLCHTPSLVIPLLCHTPPLVIPLHSRELPVLIWISIDLSIC